MQDNNKENKSIKTYLVPKNFNVISLKEMIKKKTKKDIDINLICVKYKEQEMENDLTMEVIDTRYGFDQDKNIFYYSFKKE